MINRTRLAIAGGVLAVVAFALNALLAWIDYQRDLDAHQSQNFDWVPRYWDYLRGGMGFTMHFLVAFGVAMLVVAWSMRPSEGTDNAIFKPQD